MKKVFGLTAILSLLAGVALAGQVIWTVPYGMYTHDATDLSGSADGILDQYDVLWQLIYAGPNNVADPIDLSASNFLSGDDELLFDRQLSKGNSGVFDTWLNNGGDDDACSSDLDYAYSAADPYYVFQRVYESQTPVEGTYYYETEPVLLGTDYGAGVQTVSIGGLNDTVGKQPNLIVGGPSEVPEPATMSLLGLGALAMVLRRKLRK